MNNTMETAIAWHVRLQAPDCTEQERQAFADWLAASPAHAAAFADVEGFVGAFDAQARSNSRLQQLAAEALATGEPSNVIQLGVRQSAPRRQWLLPLAAAASLVLGLLLTMHQRGLFGDPPRLETFESPVGQQRTLQLSDGSNASLDVDSLLTASIGDEARELVLLRGRALFEVAHDKERPFTVQAGSGRITALGTRFQVQRSGAQVIVTLTEGSVEVVNEVSGTTLRTRLKPGEQLRFSEESRLWLKSDVETSAVTSWSRGRHIFRNTRLADALAELNRYATKPVELGTPALAELTFSGNFITGDSSRILAAISAALPVEVTDQGNRLVLQPAADQAPGPEPERTP